MTRLSPTWDGRIIGIPVPHLMTALGCALTIVLGIGIGLSTTLGVVVLVFSAGALAVWRLGLDRAFVWSLLIPWQFIPFIQTNILFNPWIWLALSRFFVKRAPGVSSRQNWTVAVLALVPSFAYLGYALVFGVAAAGFLIWTIPALVIGISFFYRPPDTKATRQDLFLVGAIFSILIIVEFITDVSSNNLLSGVPGISDYLRSSRALGPAGNPLFSSSVLLVSFFAIPDRLKYANVYRALCLSAILMTGSKSAIIGLAIALPIAIFSLGIKKSVGLVMTLALGLFLLITSVPSAANSLIARFAVFDNLQKSDPDRAFTTSFVTEKIIENPLGGLSIGSVLAEKQLRSPVENGDRFGIESSWLAMASDVGLLVVLLVLVAVIWRLIVRFRQWETVALLALFVSLFFWNGWYGAWLVIPLWCCVVFSDSTPPIVAVSIESGCSQSHL